MIKKMKMLPPMWQDLVVTALILAVGVSAGIALAGCTPDQPAPPAQVIQAAPVPVATAPAQPGRQEVVL